MNVHEKFEAWVRDIRDPAEQNNEGTRVFRHGTAHASYNLAPVPGGWAWAAEASTNLESFGTPWSGPVASRDEALECALRLIRDFLHGYGKHGLGNKTGQRDADRVLGDLADGLFGFIEPEPEVA